MDTTYHSESPEIAAADLASRRWTRRPTRRVPSKGLCAIYNSAAIETGPDADLQLITSIW